MRVDAAVLTVLDRAETEGPHLRLIGQLDRKMYVAANKALEAAGGKWNRAAKAHVFPIDAADAIEQVILTGEITTHQELGFFPTPPPIAERLIGLADLTPEHLALEPSAGDGALARAVASICPVRCYELDPARAALVGATCCDFLTVDPEPIYDRVVMNPPFARQDDIRHVIHAYRFLKPGGLLVSVMSNGVTFRDNALTSSFRALVEQAAGSFTDLPPDAFKASGTMVRTVIAVIPASHIAPPSDPTEVVHRDGNRGDSGDLTH